MDASRSYVFLVLGLCGSVILLTLTLNLLLAANDLRFDKNILASAWQHKTHGVTYAPPISYNRPFKTLRLNDRIGEINTVIFGSSTTMSLREDAFPPFMKAYNFAQSGDSLLSVIGEAEYITRHWGKSIKFFIIPLDWSLGFLYDPGAPDTADLSAAAVIKAGNVVNLVVLSRVKDALTLPQIKNLLSILAEVLRSKHKLAAFKQIFFEPSSEDYWCPDGTLVRDFDTLSRGLCAGFRYDGSATFTNQRRVQPGQQQLLVAEAAAESSKYSQALRRTGGNPNPIIFDRLAALAHRVANAGGKVVFFLPPLMPTLEQKLVKTQYAGPYLAHTKEVLDKWAKREGLVILDAGVSEQFGCEPTEFIDQHHALPSCYKKVFARFWKVYLSPQGVKPGLTAVESEWSAQPEISEIF